MGDPTTRLAPRLVRSFLFLLCITTAASGCARKVNPPNVLLITSDTLRADRLGSYGSTSTSTPVLDALAARGIRFERAYSTFPKTGPAVASLLTGRYPSEHGVRQNSVPLPANERTLAEVLADAGYQTAAFVSNHVLIRRYGLGQGFEVYDDRLPDRVPTRNVSERTAKTLVNDVLEWLPSAREPLFLWVHFIDPHGPYTPPRYAERLGELAGATRDGDRLPVSRYNYVKGAIPAYQALPGLHAPSAYVALYDAEVDYLDSQLGRLLDGLDRRGLVDNALVLFSADHGEALGERAFYFQHGNTLLDAEIRIPLLASGPRIRARVDPSVVSLVDLMSVVVEYVGLKDTPAVKAPTWSLTGDLAPAADPHRRSIVLAERFGEFAAVDARRKLVWEPATGRMALYDLTSDPLELSAVPVKAEQVADLHAALVNLRLGQTPEIPRKLDPETRERLRALGYVD